MILGLKDSRYKMPPEKRKFGGSVYLYTEWRRLKSEADKAADFWRGKGWPARVVPSCHGYALYLGKKK